jgi:protein-disulfide isomerase
MAADEKASGIEKGQDIKENGQERNGSQAEENASPIYMLGIAIVLASIILSASIYFSADNIARTIEQKPFTISLPAINPIINISGIGAGNSNQAAPAAPINPPAKPTPSPAPSPSAGTQGSGAAAGSNQEINLSTRPIHGNPNAPVTIVEYSDFQCPYCQRAAATVKQIMQDYNGKVKLVYMHFPLSFHPYAKKAAEAAECAAEQGKFWEYHDRLFETGQLDIESLKSHASALGLNTTKFNNCLDSGAMEGKVLAMQNMGNKNRVSGTPTFFINGKMLVGAQPYSAFQQEIDAALAK